MGQEPGGLEGPPTPRGVDDPGPLRRWVATVLTVGVWTAVALVAIGMAWALVSGRPLDLTGASLVDVLVAGEPRSVVLLGILLLVLTPIAQLVAAAAAFVRNGERRYLGITVVVLAILVVSLVLAALTGGGAEASLLRAV